ncbi:uncharacterized protein [Amphiura filiformis]|uniref:uncharacterized protein n=1 Tax=Amphiura filiformis TaxID=82378 RepID=UPI003B221723
MFHATKETMVCTFMLLDIVVYSTYGISAEDSARFTSELSQFPAEGCPDNMTQEKCLEFVKNNECSSSPCLNGGTCHDQVRYYTCSCSGLYSGLRCENERTAFVLILSSVGVLVVGILWVIGIVICTRARYCRRSDSIDPGTTAPKHCIDIENPVIPNISGQFVISESDYTIITTKDSKMLYHPINNDTLGS